MLEAGRRRACLISLDRREKVGNRGRFWANPRRIAGLFNEDLTGIGPILPLLQQVHDFSNTLLGASVPDASRNSEHSVPWTVFSDDGTCQSVRSGRRPAPSRAYGVFCQSRAKIRCGLGRYDGPNRGIAERNREFCDGEAALARRARAAVSPSGATWVQGGPKMGWKLVVVRCAGPSGTTK
jgi:hypothetical protein